MTAGVWTVLVAAAVLAAPPAWAQACPEAGNARTEAGWTAFRAGNVDAARAAFEAALARCPRHLGARTGAGYVALRQDRATEARRAFESVATDAPRSVDALVGLGLAAWRLGDRDAARAAFTRVQALDAANAEARDYLARLGPAPAARPARPPLRLPDTLTYPARTHGDRFEIRTARGWEPFYIKGVNLGAALPGKHPSEFPDSATYAGWLAQMAEMGTNTVRVYTIHPPHFYGAVRAHNLAHPRAPLWLVHGVWAELPPSDDFAGAAWEGEFFREMRDVVDVLHGRADVVERPGHAGGFFTADVSPWVLAYIIGREWEPISVVEFNRLHPELRAFRGRYLVMEGGTPMDAWLARASEHIVAYETETYRAQRPVAYTNWPTLDPITHPTESTVAEEVAIRERLGEQVGTPPPPFDNDATGLDANLVKPTAALPAGWFASYHAYPYYPDFMVLDRGYNAARSSEGPSNYFGYLTHLKRHHANLPVVISEYGVPASIGSAHLQPQGQHHGGVTEAQMAAIDARLTREIAEAGMAGGVVFAWIDEWFKKNWLVMPFEIPLERTRLWHNRLDAEQHYGMVAMDPGEVVPGATLAARAAAWRARPALSSAAGVTVRAAADEAYLWLYVEHGGADEVLVGFDVVKPAAGDFRWPGQVGERLPVGLEFVLQARGGEVRLLADPASNPLAVGASRPLAVDPVPPPAMEAPLPGFFWGRFQQWYNRPFLSRPNADGMYDSMRVLTNRRRFGRDGVEYASFGYDRGLLRQGNAPDGLWERGDGVLEVRIPWMLLNFTDPSERRVLQDPPGAPPAEFGTAAVEGIRLMAAARRGDRWTQWPAAAPFTWPAWEAPRWRARTRPVFDSMRETFRTMATPVTENDR
ncbi:tetratricopeptide repeat protein [Longimicrobium sp.]|jgi:hypothetical protein|uniref:tetratricopeptide repeat protein n=1 Tax=Longimicrobium sp. TaxID=2029185 RepID=UPI002EDACF62